MSTAAQSSTGQQRKKCTYKGKVTSPKDGTEVPFDKDVTVTGEATKTCDDGSSSDASADIRWREYAPRQYRGKGPSYTFKFQDRKNPRVAMYVKDKDVAHVDLKIVCDAIDPKSPPSNELLALALIMLTEGRSCTLAEKEAIGTCVINRLLNYPAKFGSSVRAVIEKPGQFDAAKYRLYGMSVDNPDYIRTVFSYEECTEFKPVLPLAAQVLARKTTYTPAGFGGAPYFFKVSDALTGDAGVHSPQVKAKGVDGFKQSFYGYDGR